MIMANTGVIEYGQSGGERDRLLHCYVLCVKTGAEGRYMEWAGKFLPPDEGRLFWPRRVLDLRKGGKIFEKTASLYPGYLFYDAGELSDEAIMVFRRTPGFIKFLKSNYNIVPLQENEREILLDMMSSGELIQKSKVLFDENSRIKIVEGPLKRFEGSILKVDRRKKRAKVKISMHGRWITVDLGFEVMEALSAE